MRPALLIVAGAAFFVWAWFMWRRYAMGTESDYEREVRYGAFVVLLGSLVTYAASREPKDES